MLIGILSDTHDRLERTRRAVELLRGAGAISLVHCGDFTTPEILLACAVLPTYFVFGNNDADMAGRLKTTAAECGATCLGWGGEVALAGKRVAVCHGHLTRDLRPLLLAEPDYLLTGHSHEAGDWRGEPLRRINPGALHRAARYTVALLDLARDELRFIEVPR